MTEIIETKILCKQAGRYIGWPSVAQSGTGDLLTVFSGDREAHVSKDGRVFIARSADGGTTWSEPSVVYSTPIDDRDSGIMVTEQNTVIVSWFTGPYGGDWQGHWTVRSVDDGQTWQNPVPSHVSTPHGPIQLRDGRLLFLGQRPHCSHGDPPDWNGPPDDSPYSVSIAESRDDGRAWKVIGDFPVPAGDPMLTYDEPHMGELDHGELFAMFRDCNGDHHLRQSRSPDGGITWSPPVSSPIRGLPPHLLRLADGELLVTYGKRWEPFGIYACVSGDGGQTWDLANETRLSCAPNDDLGYPASVQMEDGSIWSVYYQIDQPGEKPCLMGTHWHP